MSQSQNNLSLIINRQDSSGVSVENRTVGAISFAGVAGEFEVRTAPDANIHTLDLPTTIILQVYIKNTHATAAITLTGTPQGGASATLAVLPPGGIWSYWAPVTSATAGFTQLRYTSDTIGGTMEYFLGG